MKRMVLEGVFIYLLLAFIAPLSANSSQDQEPSVQPLTLGVLSYRPKPQTIERWQPLVAYLNEAFDTVHLELVPYFMDEMQEALAQGEVDFIFTQPSHYVLLTYRYELSSPLAMLVNNEAGVPVSSFAGVIFTSASSRLQNLSDLKGQTIATPQKESLGAYQMQAFELFQAGLQASRDYQTLEVGMPKDKVVEAVLEGRAQAGFVRSGVLESLMGQNKLDKEAVRLLDEQQHPDFPFQVSTRLYPEWPLVALSGTDPLVVRQLVSALFNLPLHGELAQAMDIAGFTLPGDFRTIDELLYQLKLPPFEYRNELDILQAWQQWQPQGGVLLSLLVLILLVAMGLVVVRNRELYQAHAQLKTSGEEVYRLSQAMEQSPEAVAITDTQARFEYVNPAFEAHTGFSKKELLGENPRVLASGATPQKTYRDLWRHLKRGHVWRGEFINRRKDASEYLVSVLIAPIRSRADQITHFLAVEQDVTEKRAVEKRLNHLTYYDALTGLPNRGLQMDRIDQNLVTSEKSGQMAALLLIDLDRFQLINDARGLAQGDQVLLIIAERIKEILPDSASLARMAADEFSVLLQGLHSKPEQASREALGCVKGIQDRLKESMLVEGQTLFVTASVGITLFPETDCEMSSSILNRADTALHRAKSLGGNGYRFYETCMGQQVSGDFDLENDLRAALGLGQLSLYLQPQCSVTGELVGAEALLRWQHPEKGAISPGDFIPLAENSDLIVDLDRWVFQQLLVFLQSDAGQGNYSVSINISPKHFARQDFAEWIQAELHGQSVKLNRLVLEFTEGVLIDDIEAAISKMQQLTSLGLKFSVDDFGTGYSSLAYLKQLPLHELKIDRAFIKNIGPSSKDLALVKSILAIADCMNLQVVVEGVETIEQLSFFQACSSLTIQGFYFSKPFRIQSLPKGPYPLKTVDGALNKPLIND